MYQLTPDEKTTTVMVYTRNKLVHGDLVTRQTVKVSILPRMQAFANYLHLLNTQIWLFGGGEPRVLKYSEYFFPMDRMIGLHIAPPNCDPPDFTAGLVNRTMMDISMIMGVFVVKGQIRVSTQVPLAGNLELVYKNWLSVYDADISTPFLAKMPIIHVPMILVKPAEASFGIASDEKAS
jgi:hypothetical protein